MSAQLDREGIFKVRPVSWRVKTFDGKKSVAIAIEFVVLGQLGEDNEWVDWSDYEEHRVWGDYFVIGREGKPNDKTCDQLATSLGWKGSLKAIPAGPPPDCVVQVTVKPDTYEGKTTYKAGWMNPQDYVPTAGGAGSAEVDALEASFGSLLRAATASKAAGAAKKAAPPAKPPQSAPVNPPF